jgi:BirA family biotin operon repressor/biotin-[acetyl-CoA-carboxylase] ligase
LEHEIIELEEIDSTNDELRRLAEKGAKHFTIVAAKKQTRGKGRYSRIWDSPKGNLYLSILIKNTKLETAYQLSFVASLAVLDTIQTFLPAHDAKLKWPNDVLVDGKKIAGILLESSSSQVGKMNYLIIGFGINVKESPDYATNMKDLGFKQAFGSLKQHLIEKFEQLYTIWLEEGFGRIGELWLRNAAYLGEKIRANLPEKEVEGIFRGLTPQGELILETTDGEKLISSGEVFYGT